MTIRVRSRRNRPLKAPLPSRRIRPNAPTISPVCAESSTACSGASAFALGATAALRPTEVGRPPRNWVEIEVIGFSLSRLGRAQGLANHAHPAADGPPAAGYLTE